MNNNRRNFLAGSVGVLTSLWIPKAFTKEAEICVPTARQTSGPFYPGEARIGNIVDLTVNEQSGARAKGQLIYISGIIKDDLCRPIPNAVVEIWQACETGKYDHQHDPNTATLDPNFRYSARAITDQLGHYNFKTIVPGAYQADRNWMRPPHIHYRVSALGHREIITQMYFKGNVYNESDLILLDTPASQRSDLVVDFVQSPQGLERTSLSGRFDLTLHRIRS